MLQIRVLDNQGLKKVWTTGFLCKVRKNMRAKPIFSPDSVGLGAILDEAGQS